MQLILWPLESCIFGQKRPLHRKFWKGASTPSSRFLMNFYQETLEFSTKVEEIGGDVHLTSFQPRECNDGINAIWGCSRGARELIFYVAESFCAAVFMSYFLRLWRLFEIRGRSRSLEAVRGRGQIWHPEIRGSHLSTIYGGLSGPRLLMATYDYHKWCLRIWELADWTHILCEVLKLKFITTSKQPRGCRSILKFQGLLLLLLLMNASWN